VLIPLFGARAAVHRVQVGVHLASVKLPHVSLCATKVSGG
jgi:hypothetical protein